MRVTEYRGVTIIAHPRNGQVRFAWRDVFGGIQYAKTIRMAKLSIDSEHRVIEKVGEDVMQTVLAQ